MHDKLGLKELIAIGIGSMIGGGIFSVMGLANAIAGHATVFVFVMGGIIAMFAGYNYARLAVTYRQDGASYTYLRHAFANKPMIAAFVGWSVIIGYIGTLALYAYTFGAYGSAMLGYADNVPIRILLAFLILSIFLFINLQGVRETGESEDVIVFFKVAIMMTLGIVGLFYIEPAHFRPLFDKGFSSILLSGALVFVAFEGFQLITNTVVETEDPERNTPLSIYLSILIVTLIYITLAISVMGVLTHEEIQASKEYAIAEALKPIFGEWGFVLASIAALLATGSAINGTLFGASRMLADIAHDGIFPSILARRNHKMIPYYALLLMFILAALFVLFGELESIVAFSSITFLLVSLAVGVANFILRRKTGSNIFIVTASILLMSGTIGLMLYHLYHENPKTLIDIGMIYLLIALLFFIFRMTKR
ncbi:APC family permease [Hydrogenimonas cancrithermarum]|uniref:Amino acid transporter n=1 Tax=Hydrogenimonas cancrithermarum TaxID=2993563 RepID=A0ABM8FJP7_9BACT|nr:APC family permease [Hydrogenimonas cancrithermarum]BDY12510.1 amino acid transporter [Hydrogenimonas cancrithermarum]